MITCRVVATVLQPLQASDQSLEYLPACFRFQVVEVRENSYGREVRWRRELAFDRNLFWWFSVVFKHFQQSSSGIAW